ncbi:unnamed protein product, partial [Rhizoctonia solani]
ETFTSEIPFAGKTDRWVMMHILHEEIPSRPQKVIPAKSIDGDKLWATLTKCWSYDPKDRPSARAVWDEMKPITSDTLKEIEDKNKNEGGSKGESDGNEMGDKE